MRRPKNGSMRPCPRRLNMSQQRIQLTRLASRCRVVLIARQDLSASGSVWSRSTSCIGHPVLLAIRRHTAILTVKRPPVPIRTPSGRPATPANREHRWSQGMEGERSSPRSTDWESPHPGRSPLGPPAAKHADANAGRNPHPCTGHIPPGSDGSAARRSPANSTLTRSLTSSRYSRPRSTPTTT